MASSNERKLFRVSVICILIIAVITSMIISLIWGSNTRIINWRFGIHYGLVS